MVLPSFARFWMIARKPTRAATRTEPRQRYSHRADAVQAAQKLADQTGAPFILLEAVETIHPKQDEGSLL